MRRPNTYTLSILLLWMMSLFSELVSAEIYKWVDADGKVHFGDKPHDPDIARAAQPVELGNSYQPAARTAAEQEAYDEEQHKKMLRDQMRRRDAKQARQQAAVERREHQTELCGHLAQSVKELSTVEIKNGVRILPYIEGEDGKSISSDRQREIIADLKTKMVEADCREI